jgi:hypothetical protein
MLLNFDLIILSDLLTKLYELIYSNLWFILSCEIVILGPIILMANRASGKILKGLQGVAATSIIVRSAFDAYKAIKGDNSSTGNDNSENNNTGNDKNNDKNKSNNTSNKKSSNYNSNNTGNTSENISK